MDNNLSWAARAINSNAPLESFVTALTASSKIELLRAVWDGATIEERFHIIEALFPDANRPRFPSMRLDEIRPDPQRRQEES